MDYGRALKPGEQQTIRYGPKSGKWVNRSVIDLAEGDTARITAGEVVVEPTPEPTPEPPPSTGPLPPVANTVPLPTDVPSGFVLQEQDDFTTDVPLGSFVGYPGSVLNGRWTAYPSGLTDTATKMTGTGGVHRPEKVLSVHDGLLDLWLHTEGGEHCVAAPRLWPGLDRFSYGRSEVRFYADKLPGYYTAWLWWPTSEVWPRDGEIDFPEGSLTSSIKGFMHKQGATAGSDQSPWDSGQPHGQWHTAITEWLPSGCRFILSGASSPIFTDRVPNTEMRHVLQTETTPGQPPADSTQGHIWIAWYRLLRKV